MTSTMVHIRVDEATKVKATETLAALGLSVSDAVRLFLRRVVIEQGLPSDLKVPNAETQAAMGRARAMTNLRFSSAKDLADAIEEDLRGAEG
jgi:DNA-damage-inducible protein J